MNGKLPVCAPNNSQIAHWKLISVFFAALAACNGSVIDTLEVDATADIYSAGQASLPATVDPGTFAPSAAFAAAANQILTVVSTSGEVGCNYALTNGADGTCLPGVNTRVLGVDGLSGISANAENFFLVGVFLGSDPPSGIAPSTLSYDFGTADSLSTGDLTYQPQLGQVFFIGDGLTGAGSGSQQQFYVPAQATSLYLGFADSFDSYPSYYADNVGSLDVTVQIAAAAPEPASFFLAFLGILLTAVISRWARSAKVSATSAE